MLTTVIARARKKEKQANVSILLLFHVFHNSPHQIIRIILTLTSISEQHSLSEVYLWT